MPRTDAPSPDMHAPKFDVAARSARLRQARIAAGFKSAIAAATRFGWNRNTYSSNENGNATFSYRRAEEYAAAFGASPHWLYTGETTPKPTRRQRRRDLIGSRLEVAIVGEVGTNGVCSFEPIAMAAAPSLLPQGHVYLRVAAAGAMPGMPAGSLLAFLPGESPPEDSLVDKLVIAGLSNDVAVCGDLAWRNSAYAITGLEGAVIWAQPVEMIVLPGLASQIVRPLDAPP